MQLNEALGMIKELDIDAMKFAKARLDNLTKPIGSLGKMEDMIIKLSGIFKNPYPQISQKAVIIMCADNGVCEEGVSSCPKEVTATVTQNFTKGITGINVFARKAGADIFVVDVGVDADLLSNAGIIHKKIRKGTWNITKGAAMTRGEAIRAIETGIETICDLKDKGYNFFATGEMGIGNTTTCSCVSSALLSLSCEEMVGKGSGLTKEAYLNKVMVVKRALEVNSPDTNDAIDVVSKVGGFDIAAMAGCFIGSAANGLPMLIDGVISATAALVALRIAPGVKDYIFATHLSQEPAAKRILDSLGLEAFLHLDMRLGEGTGAALGFQVFDTAISAYTQMGTFDDARIQKYVPQE